MPKVSIVMPVHNGEQFLARAIDSALAQHFADWELVVIDDASTDGTVGVLASYSDARIRVISQNRGGEAVARNRGLEAATGEYLAFLDADDLYLPNSLGDMSSYLDAHPEIDCVFCDGYFCDEKDEILGRLSAVRPGVFTGDILEPLLLDPAVITVPVCTMTRLRTIRAACVRFDPALVIGPDWDFWIYLARHARFGYLGRPTCMYRVHNANVSRTVGRERRRADLVAGRRKVLNASWFGEISTSTRVTFFHNLLLGLLARQPDEQRTIVDTDQFRVLPARSQARLLRHMASEHVAHGRHTGWVQTCLTQSVSIAPEDRYSQILLRLWRMAPFVCRACVVTWRALRSAGRAARGLCRGGARALPSGLRALR